MPKRLIFAVTLFAVAGASLLMWSPMAQSEEASQQKKPAAELNTKDVSYALGVDIGEAFKQQQIEINLDELAEGIAAGLGQQEARMTDKQIQQTMRTLQRHLQQKQMAERKTQAKAQKEQGDAFLKKNKAKEGVEVTESGLQYKVVEEGDGASPGAKDSVVVHYTGKLVGGKTFDSSRERGEPAEFQVGRVIKGWSEGLQLMEEGGRYKLFVPGDLGYGERGHPRAGIPPNATLVFDVELIEVKQAGEKSE